MELLPFYQAPKQLFRCNGFISKTTGQPVELTHSAKIVFMYMMDRTSFFTDDQKSDHYETQATIADACGMEYKAAARALKSFVEHGAIIAKKQRNLKLSPHSQWYYKSVDTTIELFKKDGSDYVCMSNGVVIGVTSKKEVVDNDDHTEYSDDFLNSIDFTGECI